MIRECVPVGRLCDPMTIASALRGWMHKYMQRPTGGSMASSPLRDLDAQRWARLESLMASGAELFVDYPTLNREELIQSIHTLRAWIDALGTLSYGGPHEPCR